MLVDLVGGQIPACIDTHVELIELHRAGRLRVLATTGGTRSSRMPDVPTMREVGLPQVEGSGWFAFYVPAATPAATVARLNAAIDRISHRPDVRDRLAQVGVDVATLSPGGLDRLAADERERWAPVIRASGFKGE
jgi:tripartite-type tricarboxylate transporter receptor subunit TctC